MPMTRTADNIFENAKDLKKKMCGLRPRPGDCFLAPLYILQTILLVGMVIQGFGFETLAKQSQLKAEAWLIGANSPGRFRQS